MSRIKERRDERSEDHRLWTRARNNRARDTITEQEK
jgi:hypothetical protein